MMNRFLSGFFILFITVILSGCDASFDPKKNYEEKYLLNLVIKGDSVKQIAIAAKTYDVPGFNPNENSVSPFISGAAISIYSKFYSNTYLFKDSTSSEIGQKYGSPAPVYVLNQMKARPNDTLTLTATMPNGKVLKSKCVVPRDLDFRLSKNFISTITQNPTEKALTIQWTGSPDNIYVPKLVLYYATDKNGVVKGYKKEIPLKYVDVAGTQKPLFPGITRDKILIYEYASINKIMSDISAGDQDKYSYVIQDAILEVLVMDKNLGNYYGSTEGFLDDFSVRLDEVVFSNIEGGLGVFGAYLVSSRKINVEENFVQSFGYRSRL
ncbi:hypothetical protein MASR1M107_02910 [Ignavibacteriales bacterium]